MNGGTSNQSITSIQIHRLDKKDFVFDLTKDKLKFKGWSYNGVLVFDQNGVIVNSVELQNEMTFKAEFAEEVTLTIIYTLYNPKTNEVAEQYNECIDSFGKISKTTTYSWNTYINLFADLNNGLSFEGWYYDDNLLSNETSYNYMMWDEDIIIEARIKYKIYELDIKAEKEELGFVTIKPNQLYNIEYRVNNYYTEQATIVAYSKTETRFLGWFDENNNLVSANIAYTFNMPSNNYTLIAKWDYFVINYHLNNGINNEYNITSYSTADSDFSLLEPTREGYTFVGWYYNEQLISVIETSTIIDYELYASWKNNTYRIIYDVNGGNELDDSIQNVTYNSTYSLKKPDRDGYTFIGWYEEDDTLMEITEYDTWNRTSDIYLYARWQINQYTANYYFNDNLYYSYTEDYNTIIESPILPLGYDFIGWYENGTLLSNEINYQFLLQGNIDITLEAQIKDELKDFILDDSIYHIRIIGVRNKNKNILIVPNSVASIGDSAFSNCSYLKSIALGDGIICIENNAFENCSNLTAITIPDSVTSIGNNAFKNCSSLISFIIPNSVTSIGSSAFSGCSNLTKITLPFVGNTQHTPNDTNQYPFGYIFGSSGYTGGISTQSDGLIIGTLYNTYYIPQALKEVVLTESSYIPDGAFYGCSNLTSITIPDSITSIGNHAFCNCSGLTSITIPDSVTSIGINAFSRCSNLTSITIPDSVTFIMGLNQTFYHCSSLTSITIPDSVTSIEDNAFSYCSSLKSITIPDSVTSIGNYAFDGCSSLTSITIPDSVTSIGFNAFNGCSNLTSITIPDSVTSISFAAFDGCSSLTSITIPDSVTNIGSCAFFGCSGLTSITIPDSVTSIEDNAFSGCSGLTSITIPNSVTSIGSGAFSGCGSLETIVVGNKNSRYDSRNNCNAIIETKTNRLLVGCSNTVIPNSVTSIGDSAFFGCSGLTSITIPDSVTSIGDRAFSGCGSLETIVVCNKNSRYDSRNNCNAIIETKTNRLLVGCSNTVIPNGVTSIGSGAFSGCSNLTSITIPNSVKSIGESAFSRCITLQSIIIPNSVTSIGSGAFSECSSLTIYCSHKSKPSGWSNSWNYSNRPVVWGI